MDLYAPDKLSSMTLKQLREAKYDMVQDITELEAMPRLSSAQTIGLRNLKASLEIATDLLDSGHGGPIVGKKVSAKPSGDYMTFQAIDGTPVYGVRADQKFADIPGQKPSEDPYAVGSLIRAALTGNRSGLSGEVLAALNESVGSQGGYNVPSVLSSQVIDLMRSQNVMTAAGMPTINMTSDNLKIARVTADPEFYPKLENQKFTEDDSMRFGAISIYPRMVGCLIRASLEVIEDAPNFPQLITETIAKAFSESIDAYALNGTGDDLTPRGLLSFDEIATTAATGLNSQTVSAAALAIRNRNHNPSAAIMTVTDRHSIMEFKDSTGQWLGLSPALGDVRMLASTKVPADTMVIGNFSQFVLALRNGFRLDFTDVGAEAFERNQRVFRVFWRGNFAVLDENALQIVNIDSTTTSTTTTAG